MKKVKKQKTKQKHTYRKLFGIIALIMSLNIVLVYVNAQVLSAETEIEIPDETVTVEILDTTPEFADAVECYMYAESLMLQNTIYATTEGYVKGSAPVVGEMVYQTMNNTRTTDNNGIKYSTSVSLKKGNMGRNNYQQVAFDARKQDGLVYKIVSDEAGDGNGDFTNSSWCSYEQKEFCASNGSLPGTMTYIVRKSTVDSVDIFERTEDGGYHIKLTLNNTTSTKNYRILLKNSAGDFATGFPTFSYVGIEAWIDKDGHFIKNIMDDKAKINIAGVGCQMVSHYEETFHTIGGSVEAPFQAPFAI